MYVLDITLYNIPYYDKSDLGAGENVLKASLIYGPIRDHHPIQKFFDEETQETRMENKEVDKDVSYIMSGMLQTKSQSLKENDDVTHENNFVSDDNHVLKGVKVDIVVPQVGIVNNHNKKRKFASKGKMDHVVKDMETLCEDVVINDENIFLGCVANNKVYKLFNKGS